MNKKIILLIIPIVLILLSVHLFSRFSTIEDNLRYQYGTPIAVIEIVDEDSKLVLFSMADNMGLTTYEKLLGFYSVKDDFGHVKVKDYAHVVLSERGLDTLVLWGNVDVDVKVVEFVFIKDETEVVVSASLKNRYFCEILKTSFEIDDSWELNVRYQADGEEHQIENVVLTLE